MIAEKSLVIYKNRPAIVTGLEGEKLNIAVFRGDIFKVREKDIELLHPGPCTGKDLEENPTEENGRDVWELLVSDDADNAAGTTLKELAELVYGDFSPRNALAAWELLREGLYFTGDIKQIRARPAVMVEEDEKKREEKKQESAERAALMEKLKKLPPFKAFSAAEAGLAENISAGDRRFLQDVEALARGQTDKSRTLKELGKSETCEEAHKLLLASGVWTVWENPHPARFGFSIGSSKTVLHKPPEEKRLDLSDLAAYAIDNPWSDDPDDAVSLEGPDASGVYTLWVHVADPAASILPGSEADKEACGRGATLYLPEGPSRMLSPEALSLFSLGIGLQGELSPALSYKITLKPDLNITETEIFPSLVRVTRLSYAEADERIAEGNADLSNLALLAERNLERRLDSGAVVIELPEARIQVNTDEKMISVEPQVFYRSADMVRECMIWAGEGAARWAMQKKLPFPFISQEAGELPSQRLSGLAGAWQLRRCMRPRTLSGKPGVHWGLGLDQYTQVTSPLRRYIDLLCHQQIRAWINSGAYEGRSPLGEDELLVRAAAAEAAAAAASRAERASKMFWMAVYLSGKKDLCWEAVVLERKGNNGTVIIPALGIETQLIFRGNEKPNEKTQLKLSSVKIPEGELGFVQV